MPVGRVLPNKRLVLQTGERQIAKGVKIPVHPTTFKGQGHSRSGRQVHLAVYVMAWLRAVTRNALQLKGLPQLLLTHQRKGPWWLRPVYCTMVETPVDSITQLPSWLLQAVYDLSSPRHGGDTDGYKTTPLAKQCLQIIVMSLHPVSTSNYAEE